MDDFVAYPSRWRIAKLLIAAILFVLGGAYMAGLLGDPPTSDHYPRFVIVAMGWVEMVLFGIAGISSAFRMFDGRERLRIGTAGIWSSTLYNQTVPWSEIVDVTIWRHRRQRFIILHLRDPDRFPQRGSTALLRGANRMLTGGHIALSLTGTDRSFDDAMQAIARFRRVSRQVRMD